MKRVACVVSLLVVGSACAAADAPEPQPPTQGASMAASTASEASAEPASTATSGTPEAVVQAQLEAYNARDIDAFMATFHPEAELFAIGDPNPRARGAKAVRALYADLFERSPNLHSELVHRAALGARVIDHERITGREGGEVLEIVMIYEVEDGGIRRAWAVK